MIAIIDYDAGNMMSVVKAFSHLGQEITVTRDEAALDKADKIILPGVGSFGDAMDRLNGYGLVPVIRRCIKEDKPFLGICLGLQLLYESSGEAPGVKGIGVLSGRIGKIPKGEYKKIPHMGWNSLSFPNEGRLFKGIGPNPYVYFVHSYYLEAADRSTVTATTDYNVTIDASIECKNLFACQFHPEKSGSVGLAILENFIRL
ncbi:MAG: imidazole glycerol phosphate synthase subunit HisH [Lachnospiraceae bacterium]|nr:imidazole glycerol phosphate synthase subunit HisH [Lachnospiraceae bacterium]